VYTGGAGIASGAGIGIGVRTMGRKTGGAEVAGCCVGHNWALAIPAAIVKNIAIRFIFLLGFRLRKRFGRVPPALRQGDHSGSTPIDFNHTRSTSAKRFAIDQSIMASMYASSVS